MENDTIWCVYRFNLDVEDWEVIGFYSRKGDCEAAIAAMPNISKHNPVKVPVERTFAKLRDEITQLRLRSLGLKVAVVDQSVEVADQSDAAKLTG